MTGRTHGWISCEVHGKRGWTSRAAAKKCIRGLSDSRHMGVYRCTNDPTLWHVGHKPSALIAGRLTRSEITPRGTTP